MGENYRILVRSELSDLRLALAILDAMGSVAGLLDQHARIVAVNRQWIDAAGIAGGEESSSPMGLNYLAVCEGASGPGSENARAAAEGIRAVLNGPDQSFELLYPCFLGDAERWFTLRVRSCHRQGASHASRFDRIGDVAQEG